MQIKELIDCFEEKINPSVQEKWDNSGLQLGDINQELKGIVTTLEITSQVIDFAIENQCNLIFCHHPLIFGGINSIDKYDFKGKKIIKAIQNDIVIYASHTPSDMMGFNEYILNRMGFESNGIIKEMGEGLYYGNYSNIDMKFNTLIEQIKINLDLDHVITYGHIERVKKVGVVTGSGMDFVEDAINKEIEVYITSDITHHHAMDAMEKGLVLIDISHEGSERYFTYFAENILSEFINDDMKLLKYENEPKYIRQII